MDYASLGHTTRQWFDTTPLPASVRNGIADAIEAFAPVVDGVEACLEALNAFAEAFNNEGAVEEDDSDILSKAYDIIDHGSPWESRWAQRAVDNYDDLTPFREIIEAMHNQLVI